MITILNVLLGMVLLSFGASMMVDGSKNLALKFNIRPIVVGLTIVALATSSPELLVSLTSALKGHGGMALGNVVGSNIANIALGLAIAGVIRPFHVSRQALRFDMPVMLLVSLLFCVFCYGGELTRLEGCALLAILVVYMVFCVKGAKNSAKQGGGVQESPPMKSRVYYMILTLVGCAAIVGGAHFLVTGGIALARAYHISETVIGLTVLALGTSLPEFAACVAAAIKKQSDIGVGNIIGSNIFNLALVIGIIPCIRPITVSGPSIDFVVMMAYAFALFGVLGLTKRFGRIAGSLFILSYVAYICFIVGR